MKYQVEVSETGQSFECDAGQNLLEGMRTFRFGAPMAEAIPVGCRGGGCGVCRIKVLSGNYELASMSTRHVPDKDREEGLALACRVFPRSDLNIALMPLPEALRKPL